MEAVEEEDGVTDGVGELDAVGDAVPVAVTAGVGVTSAVGEADGVVVVEGDGVLEAVEVGVTLVLAVVAGVMEGDSEDVAELDGRGVTDAAGLPEVDVVGAGVLDGVLVAIGVPDGVGSEEDEGVGALLGDGVGVTTPQSKYWSIWQMTNPCLSLQSVSSRKFPFLMYPHRGVEPDHEDVPASQTESRHAGKLLPINPNLTVSIRDVSPAKLSTHAHSWSLASSIAPSQQFGLLSDIARHSDLAVTHSAPEWMEARAAPSASQRFSA